MLKDRDRLQRRAATPRLVALYRALGRLRSTVTVMNTGAHPDDEHNGMLATLRHQHGMRIVVACSTRGEGGQNTLGPERGGALGLVRTREMEEAARALDADIAWLGHGPDDPVHDFGFSKSGPDTLARWGEERIVERLVRAYRQFRPDIVIPTFLDVPGQHGHHRAMTQAAGTAIALAADPSYRTDDLRAWQVAKFYLPAWSGGGDTYDDEVPPPPATTSVWAVDTDPATGMSYDRLGEVSRAFHASQNMGFWQHPAQTRWSLHLVGGAQENSVLDGLPKSLAQLGASPNLAIADVAMEKARACFPDGEAVARALIEARHAIALAIGDIAAEHAHRLERKMEEINAALVLAAGIDITVAPSSADVVPGGSVDLVLEAESGLATSLEVTPVSSAAFEPAAAGPISDGKASITLQVKSDAPITNAFAGDWRSLGGNGNVWIRAEATVLGETIDFAVDTEEPVQLAPSHQLSITPDTLIIPLGAASARSITIKSDVAADRIAVSPPPGISVSTQPGTLTISPDASLQAGRHFLPIHVDGVPAYAVTPIHYAHIGRSRFARPLTLNILALDLAVPTTRVGYIGGGADRVGFWLDRMGANVTTLDTDELGGDLAGFDTIVVGIFAFGTRPDLAAATARLHAWVRAGGHLVTLYHRPSDGWLPHSTPPLPLTIGSPSLRWRVTDPEAKVTILEPDHPLLIGPNRITAADFEGWDKERGLYFASAWDDAYQPLLSMSDAGESSLTGSLLSARIDKGRHTHTSLVLHHQMDKLVPGALRLMANLLQAG